MLREGHSYVYKTLTSTSNPDVMVMCRLMRIWPGLSSSRHNFVEALMLFPNKVTDRCRANAKDCKKFTMLNNFEQSHLCMLLWSMSRVVFLEPNDGRYEIRINISVRVSTRNERSRISVGC
jgi:hypothetical protein